MTLALSLALIPFAFIGCDSDTTADTENTGTLIFNANGEGFVKDGFTSEDGWAITFDHVYVNIEGPTAYQVAVAAESESRHAGHDHGDVPDGSAHSSLTGQYFVDLKRADGSDVFEIGRTTEASIGNYNYLNFSMANINAATTYSDAMKNLNSGDSTDPHTYDGYCLVLIGTATKGSDTVNFTIKFDQAMKFYECGPQADLDENGTADGILAAEGTASTQMTFHFDHIFGDFTEGDPTPTDPELMSFWGIGFQPFADVDNDYAPGTSTIEIDQADMANGATGSTAMNNDTYFHLYSTLLTLGHLGEGHCHASTIE